MLKICFLIVLTLTITKTFQSQCNRDKLLQLAKQICRWKEDFKGDLNTLKRIEVACQLKEGGIDLDDVCLGLTLVPGAGSACDLYSGIKKGDTVDIIAGGAFLALDIVSFGAGSLIKSGAKSVTALAKTVQKGGKIGKTFRVSFKQFKSLRLAAKQLQSLQNIQNNIETAKKIGKEMKKVKDYDYKIRKIKQFIDEGQKCEEIFAK